jgi:glycosyltransferase involved in cell wall biosynthesis
MNLENQPKITIAIPTFNRAVLLGQTIDSVLKQSYVSIEIIVSDNCSTDNTSEVVAAYRDKRIVYFRQAENLGMVGNWNFCLQQATGEYFLLLSDDDLLEENSIESLLAAFSYIDKDGMVIPGISQRAPHVETGESFIANTLLGKRVVFPAAAIYRTKAAVQLGGYPSIGTATDLVLHLMLAMLGQVAHDPRPLIRYRMHSQSLSYTEQAIHSQANLVEWVRNESCPLKKFEMQIVKRSVKFIFSWGRFNALEGKHDNAVLALKMLQRIAPSPWWSVWFYIFDTPLLRGAAIIQVKTKQWVKRLIYLRVL